MATYTNYKSLEKPLSTEKYNIDVANKNNDVIDSELHKLDLKNQSQDKLLATKTSLNEHALNKANPHEVTKSQVGLGNADNTSDINKPVSMAQQNAIDTALEQSNYYTDNKIAELIDDAPETLDTLKEVADAIAENETVVEALNAAIGTKANQTELDSHTGNDTIHVTQPDKNNWNEHEKNTIIGIKKNGIELPITEDRKVNIIIPEVGLVNKESSGLCPQLDESDNKFLQSDGTWGIPNGKVVALTQEEYNALPDTKNSDDVIYFVKDGTGTNSGGSSSGSDDRFPFGFRDFYNNPNFYTERITSGSYLPIFTDSEEAVDEWEEFPDDGREEPPVEGEYAPDEEVEGESVLDDNVEEVEGTLESDGGSEEESPDPSPDEDDATEEEDPNTEYINNLAGIRPWIFFYSLIDAVSDYKNTVSLRRMTFRGEYLGDRLSYDQKVQIRHGTFEDLFVGDYWEMNGVRWQIVDFNYWMNKGNPAIEVPHVVLMPTTSLYTGAMNSTDIVTGGYGNSKMYKTGLDQARNQMESVFGAPYILKHPYWDGFDSANHWKMVDAEIPSEIMIYGYPHYMHNNNNNFNALFTASNHQLSLMKVNPISIDTDDHNTTYWLQDVASNTQFATSFYSGGPHLAAASGILGVRPVFAITA
ncbi:hypothetical protein D7X98_16575 [bacterium 1XD8-76]|nr:hypothetical protein D7X98_16575 [bacterium 1XD8-76]